eukprot:jgi/Chlat1/2394/Chrsp17S08738
MALFLVASLLMWIFRDYAKHVNDSISVFVKCNGDAGCLGKEAVLRLSFGCFSFFFIMMVSTLAIKRSDSPRAVWHYGVWPLKVLLFFGLLFLPFLIPSAVMQAYGQAARIGAGIFLLIQVIILLDFIYELNERWLEHDNRLKLTKKKPRSKWAIISVSVVCYIGALAIMIFCFIFFVPHSNCGRNITFVTLTIAFAIGFTAISLHPKVNAGLMTSGIMSIYCFYLCYSAIMSEPVDAGKFTSRCNTRERQTGSEKEWTNIVSFILALLTVVYSTASSGIESKAFAIASAKQADMRGTDDAEVSYSYAFFHFVFCTAAMYVAMLFTSWNLTATSTKWAIDIGWTSTWVKLVSEWVSALLYIWTMVVPFIVRGREF